MKQIIINTAGIEKKACVIEDGKLVEMFVHNENKLSINGNIYVGKVENVLPGMESAFVNIGLERNSFLYVNDLREFEEKYLDGIENSDKPIEDILKKGDQVVVQILKEPRGTKGARVTTHYTVPGKYLVLMPNNDYIGISKKIKDEAERERLYNILDDIKPDSVGVIIRTDAQGKSEYEFSKEIEYLVKKWQTIEERIDDSDVGDILYEDNNLLKMILRDIFSSDVDELIIDDESVYWEAIDFISAFSSGKLQTKIKLFSENNDIFEYYNVNKQLDIALSDTVWLDCGGYIVIEKTEALISIDVNTGKNTGVHNLEETVLQTNLEAAKEIANQLRLRNLSGIIIIDFIDMKIDEDKNKLIEVFEEVLAKDRIKNNIVHFTDLGLVEMTRKRIGKTLSHNFLERCKCCNGTGYIKGANVVVEDIFNEIKSLPLDDISTINLSCSDKLYELIIDNYKVFLEAYVEKIGKKINILKEKTRKLYDYEISLGV